MGICTKESFLKDVENHSLSVLGDNDLYRHIKLSHGGSQCMQFDLITWPGYLCYTGDMGTFVFSRSPDMFGFFRNDRDEINLSYWSEKLNAVDSDGCDRSGAAKEYSSVKFKEAVRKFIMDDEVSDEISEELEAGILRDCESFNDVNAAYTAIFDFESSDGKFTFQDFEYDITEYTHRFVWCCHAILWGIKKYDASKISGNK